MGAPFIPTSDGRLMTERAFLRQQAGEKSGAGTDVCAKCSGPKEHGRLNSDKCNACGGKSRAARIARGEVKTEREVRLRVDTDTYDAMTVAATDRDLSVEAWLHDSALRVLRKDLGFTPDDR